MSRLPILLVLLCGCTSIDYLDGPVPGLERMSVEEHRVDAGEIVRRCSRCGQLGPILPLACTCINFRTNHAVIWLPHDASAATIEHERAHARGYDHPTGELRAGYAAWLASGRREIAAPVKQAQRADALPGNIGAPSRSATDEAAVAAQAGRAKP